MSMTSSNTSNKNIKKNQNAENDINSRDRNSKKRTSSNKQPLFEQFNAIVKDANQLHSNKSSKKKEKYNRKEGVTYQEHKRKSSQITNKKRKVSQPPHNISREPNYKSVSSFDESDGDIKDKSDRENPIDQSGSESDTEDEECSDNEAGAGPEPEEDSANEAAAGSESTNKIQDSVDSSSVDTTNNDSRNKYEYEYTLSPVLVRNLQWHARNHLFQQIKIIDESHLDASGDLIEEALNKLKIDRSSKNIHAYINDCRQIIKRAMCSRRGYVKYEVGKKLKSKFCCKPSI